MSAREIWVIGAARTAIGTFGDAYLGRVAAISAGIPQETPAFNVNRLCGSGLQAIISAAQTILLGEAEMATHTRGSIQPTWALDPCRRRSWH